MTGTYEIEIIHHRDGEAPLRQTINCDADMAVSYLVTVAHEIATTAGVDMAPLADWEEPRPAGHVCTSMCTHRPALPQRWSTDADDVERLRRGLRTGSHPMALRVQSAISSIEAIRPIAESDPPLE